MTPIKEEIAAIVLCAGQGTRMNSKRSKMLHELCGKPMCVWAVGEAIKIATQQVVIVLGFQAEEVQAVLESYFPKRLTFVTQVEQKGTGHAVQIAIPALGDFSGTVVITCGDTPLIESKTLKDLVQKHKLEQALLSLLSVEHLNPSGYGRIIRDTTGHVSKIVEEAEANNDEKKVTEINTGFYALSSTFLRENIHRLKASPTKGEFYLTDLAALAAEKNTVVALKGNFDNALGINDRMQLLICANILRDRITTRWMQAGVNFLAPFSTYIEDSVVLAADVTIGPNAMLHGKTEVHSGADIGAGCILKDTIVEENATLLPYSVCDGAHIGKNSNVGPFARLRPGTTLDENVRIGNFVEVKQSHFKKGSKANHLAYVGDTDIGDSTNIGAGTITCNYDGQKKHKTTLKNNVFIGSNSTLVAPLTVEAGAYVAAGSVVTKNVPTDALALGRARQENKEGYASRLRRRG